MPHAIITYRPNAQKTANLFDQILTQEILLDICLRITGQPNFRVVRDNSTYNRGRLVLVEWAGVKNYVSLSETEVGGRNSSLQSVPTAINLFYADPTPCKRLFYYFMPHNGNLFTDYHIFVYRLLMTARVEFINIAEFAPVIIREYSNVDEVIADRRDNQQNNSSNNSSYISKTLDRIQIYAKVYGASKYESTLLAIAISQIADKPIDLYNICEQDLTQLPQSSIDTILGLGNIDIHYTSFTLDKRVYLEQADRNVLRSPLYQYNLFNKIGNKKCALCGCEIPEIIQGAHIWGVSEIAHNTTLSEDDKFRHAVDGNNGLWLCQNHHKLFDANIILFDSNGEILVRNNVQDEHTEYIRSITNNQPLSANIMTDDFRWYLSQRNQLRNNILCHRLFG